MPEFMKILSKGESNKILIFIHKYILLAAATFLPILIVFNILSEDIIYFFAKQEYSGSAYVATILVATSSLTVIFLPFYPVALKINLIGFRNWISSIKFLYIALAVYLEINATTLAYANLAGAATVRLLFDSHAYTKIKVMDNIKDKI
jgi:hypothetical protein